MQVPDFPQADGLHAHRGLHVLGIVVVALGALAASASLNVADDPRLPDLQVSRAMQRASDTLEQWQAQLSHGLQVSLRAVADGRETAPAGAKPDTPTLVAQAGPATVADGDDHQQPVRADLAPRRSPQR